MIFGSTWIFGNLDRRIISSEDRGVSREGDSSRWEGFFGEGFTFWVTRFPLLDFEIRFHWRGRVEFILSQEISFEELFVFNWLQEEKNTVRFETWTTPESSMYTISMTRKLTSLEISIARNLFHVREKYPFPSGRRQGVVSLSFQTGKVSNFAEKDYCEEARKRIL